MVTVVITPTAKSADNLQRFLSTITSRSQLDRFSSGEDKGREAVRWDDGSLRPKTVDGSCRRSKSLPACCNSSKFLLTLHLSLRSNLFGPATSLKSFSSLVSSERPAVE